MSHLHRFIATLCLLLAGCLASSEDAAMQAYQEYRAAIMASDLEKLRSVVAEEHAEQFESAEAAMALEFIKAALPQDIAVKETSFAGGKGTLTLTGTSIMEGDSDSPSLAMPGEATVEMVEVDGQWKIAKEAWSFQMDLASPIFDVQPFVKEGQRPVAQKILRGHAGAITQILSTRDWSYLITISNGDFSLRVWDRETGHQLSEATLGHRPTSVALSPDGRFLLTANVNEAIMRWPLGMDGQLGEGELLIRDAGRHAALSPDGKWLAATSPESPVVVYDMATLAPVKTLERSERIRGTAFSPSGDLLAGSEGNEILLWNTGSWSARSYKMPDVSNDSSNAPVAFSPDGRHLGVVCGDSSIIVFDVEKRRIKHDFFVSGVASLAIQFSPDGGQFATAQNNQQINVWSMADHKRTGYILSKESNANALLFSPDGRYLLAGHDDRELVFWGVSAPGTKPAVALQEPRRTSNLRPPPRGTQPETHTLFSKTNYLSNPKATRHEQFWKTSGDVAIEECAPNNPCFVTRYDGKFVGTAKIPPGSEGRFVLLIGTAAPERVNEVGSRDQTGAAYIHGYGEPDSHGAAKGQHYSAETLQTDTREADAWSTIWGVFRAGKDIAKINFEIRQSDGHSAKDGSATRFDDLGVYLFDTEHEAQGFVPRYEAAMGRVAAAEAEAPAETHPAAIAPAPDGGATSKKSTSITSCNLGGRVVFMSESDCAQRSARR